MEVSPNPPQSWVKCPKGGGVCSREENFYIIAQNFADSILFLANSHQISPRPPRVVSLYKKMDGEAPSARFEDSENSEKFRPLSTLNPKL